MSTYYNICPNNMATLIEKIDKFIQDVSDMEYDLTYGNDGDEGRRRESGVFFTPIDTGEFFINNLFDGIDHDLDISKYKFIEPAVGSGMLFFLLIKKLIAMGKSNFSDIAADLIEIDPDKSQYVKHAIDDLALVLGVTFTNVNVINQDFLAYQYISEKPAFIIGNPPFAKMAPKSKWRNIYAYFVEKICHECPENSIISLIVPLSFSCAISYAGLRELVTPHEVRLIHCKSTPDPLFSFGKRKSKNTARVIRQNVTILNMIKNGNHLTYSSSLLSWHKRNRNMVLSSIVPYHDITNFPWKNGFLKPESKTILNHLNQPVQMTLGDLLDDTGQFELKTATAMNYYLGIRPIDDVGLYHSFRCSNRKNFLRCIHILQSDFFCEWYKTMGDGFHASKGFLKNIPITTSMLEITDHNLDLIQDIWDNRSNHMKTKVNKTTVYSYDFRNVLPPLL